MSDVLTLEGLSAPLRALRLLALDFPDLPAPVVDVSSIFPDRLALSFHLSQGGFTGFEAWRAALGIAPDAVDFHVQCDHRTGVLSARTEYGGADIELMGFTEVSADARMSGAGAA
ncbi:hypothetical protein HEP85_19880 [Streptomyces sp. RPA4-2]|uniref:hypothetical protein n=1 Tax=Streptomyces sp. RPA4-2 TaxID=2721244 RepID=UPI00143EF011|nr:hypothetical protein [Streptomyces sp. RPA4-2]QIY63471.1 hypothetical protein HEP85_19880 [Streptomyces sp. RPA4-2]